MSQQLVRFINFGIDPQAPQKPDHGRRLYLLPNGDFATIDSTGTVTPLATDWDSITGKPTEFPPEPHLSSKITDFAAAVVAAAPPTIDASLLTTGTLPDARLAATIARSADLTTEQNARIAGDAALSTRIDFLAANLDPAALDSIAEAAAAINTLQSEVDGKATAAQGAKADAALQPQPVDYRGVYNNGADYFPGQVVSFNGELYIRIGEPNPGYPPPGSYWAAFDPSASPAFKLWVDLSKADTVHTHAAEEITGLSSYIISSAPGLQINTTVRIGDGVSTTFPIDGLVSSDPEHVLVALNGVTQTPTTDYLVSEAAGTITFDSAPASGMQISCTALGLRTVQPPIDPTLYLFAFDISANGLTTYSGRLLNADRPAAPALPETATSWTVKRSTLNAAGQILATASATGSWAQRTTLSYT
jgi:hypothetical protein